MTKIQELQRISTQVRRDIIRMVTNAKSGHPGGSMSSADFLTALYFGVMKHDPANWTRNGKGQDVFILSAGHLTPVYYSILSRAGYFPLSELSTFRLFGTRLQGHPCIKTGLAGIFQTSGSLGQGLSAAAGIALGKKLVKRNVTDSVAVLNRRAWELVISQYVHSKTLAYIYEYASDTTRTDDPDRFSVKIKSRKSRKTEVKIS